MAKDIVPIELGLPDGDVTTLWAPTWREDDDDWEAFLGLDDDLYAFPGTPELLAFVRSSAEHDLEDHPSWATVRAEADADPLALRADDEHCYDLVGVLELLGSDPTETSVDEIDQCFAIARSIGDVCELTTVTKFFNGNPVLATVTRGVTAFDGRDGLKIWRNIRKTVAKGWDDVLDAIDGVLDTPEVDPDAAHTAQADLETAEAARPAPEPEAAPPATGYPAGSVWEKVGIDPVRIVFADQEYVTLRCYLPASGGGDRPVFLGDGEAVYVFTSTRGLGRYLADHDDDTLSRVATYDAIKIAATDGSLEVHVTDDNTYALAGLDRDLEAGPDAVDAEQLALAVEFVTDVCAYCGEDELAASVATDPAAGSSAASPLRRYLRYVLSPGAAELLEPSPPFDEEVGEWRGVVDEVRELVRTPDMV